MLHPQPIQLHLDFLNLGSGPIDRRAPVALQLPARNVLRHLLDAPLLLVNLVAEFANVFLKIGRHDQTQTARLAHAPLARALLAEDGPFPVAAAPD